MNAAVSRILDQFTTLETVRSARAKKLSGESKATDAVAERVMGWYRQLEPPPPALVAKPGTEPPPAAARDIFEIFS